MDLPHRPHRLEVAALKLTTEHFPLPLSLRELVLDRYGQGAAVPEHQALSQDDLLDYLRRNDDHRRAPLQTVLDQLEAMGDPAEPGREHRAYLEWLGASLQDWTDRFPLADPLALTLSPLRTLLSELVIKDASFLRPGAHPMHRFLDQLVNCAIGWHPDLGRAGQALLNQVETAVEELMEGLGDGNTDLEAICEDFLHDSERNRQRALRMAQRTAETEMGRARSQLARVEAARMINEQLAKFQAPANIGKFLKQDWFNSAQLVLLKFGEQSAHWKAMSRATAAVLESLQSVEELTEERRRHIFEMASRVPRDVRRWLLSLHHDTDSVDEAVGLIEFAHMRVLRQQVLELETISPIVVADDGATPADDEKTETLKAIREGQWFAIEGEGSAAQRARLSLNMPKQHRLVFTNHVGLKVLQLDYARFLVLLTQRRIKRLHQHASFSGCLTRAVGIDSVEELNALLQTADDKKGAAATPAVGDWMGFHDGEAPLLARVAVHDKQRDIYIFVNRKGIKLREHSGAELRSMMERGVVDVLEAKTSFSSEVDKARARPADHQPKE